MRGNAYGDFFSTKWAWGAGKRDCHGCASQGQERLPRLRLARTKREKFDGVGLCGYVHI